VDCPVDCPQNRRREEETSPDEAMRLK